MNDTLQYMRKKYHTPFDTDMPIVFNKYYRDHNFINLLSELEFKTGAEIGVAHGKYAEKLCQGIPGLKLFCIDPWVLDKEYEEYWADEQSQLDKLYEESKNRLSGFNCEIIRKSSMEAVKDFEPNSLDFVYIDANHNFDYVVNDIIEWEKIVKPGGIVAGHDYQFEEVGGIFFGVPYAVQAYTAAHRIKPWFVMHSNQFIDSWMWVKQ